MRVPDDNVCKNCLCIKNSRASLTLFGCQELLGMSRQSLVFFRCKLKQLPTATSTAAKRYLLARREIEE